MTQPGVPEKTEGAVPDYEDVAVCMLRDVLWEMWTEKLRGLFPLPDGARYEDITPVPGASEAFFSFILERERIASKESREEAARLRERVAAAEATLRNVEEKADAICCSVDTVVGSARFPKGLVGSMEQISREAYQIAEAARSALRETEAKEGKDG